MADISNPSTASAKSYSDFGALGELRGKAQRNEKGMETFEGMYDKELSMSMAKRNALGFADVVVRQLSQTQASPSTADLLAQRQTVNSLVTPAMPLHKPVLPMSLQQPVQTAMPLERQTLKPLRLNQSMPLTPVRNEP